MRKVHLRRFQAIHDELWQADFVLGFLIDINGDKIVDVIHNVVFTIPWYSCEGPTDGP